MINDKAAGIIILAVIGGLLWLVLRYKWMYEELKQDVENYKKLLANKQKREEKQ
jgi:hypothetical protein